MSQAGGLPPSGSDPSTAGATPPSTRLLGGVPTPDPATFASGRFSARGGRFGPYEVLGEVARGGAGVVLRGRGPDGREVAIKILRQSTDAAAERFARERALQSELGLAEGFVPLVAAGEGPGGPWLAMPFLTGGTLRDRLRRGPLDVDDAVDVVRRLAEALGRAHARGIVHRDLKPENVLFTADGVPLVADLGLAKREGAPSGMSLSVTGEFRGTAGYMAPEQMKDAKTAGPPADVFSLGAILYECLAGEPAFAGDSVVAVIEHVDTGRIVPLPKRRPETPRWLVQVVARCLTRDVDERLPDGAALAAALAAGAAGEVSGTRGLRRPHVASLALGLVVGVAVGFAAGAAWRGRDGGPADLAPVASATTPAPAVDRTPETPVAVTPTTTAEGPTIEDPPGVRSDPAPLVRSTPAHLGRATRGGPALGGAAVDMDLGKSARMEVVTRWGSPRLRHTAGVNTIDVARGVDLMASGDDHGLVRVWLRSTGQQRWSPVSTVGALRLLSISDDGQRVAYATAQGVLQVRELASEQTTKLPTEEHAVLAMTWVPGSAQLVTAYADRGVYTWDLASKELVGRTQLDVAITAVAASGDGKTLLLGTEAGTLVACDPAEQAGVWTDRRAINCGDVPIRRVAVSPDGRLAAGVIQDRGFVVWDVVANEGKVYADLLRGPAHDLEFAPDGVTVVGVDADSIVAFDCARKVMVSQQRFPVPVRAAAVAVGASTRVVFSSVRGGSLSWVDVGARELEPSITHGGWVTSLVPDGPTLFSCSADGTVRRWADPDESTVLLERDGWFHELELASERRALASAWSHVSKALGGLVVVDLTTTQSTLTSEGGVQVLSTTFAHDGRSLLSADATGMIDVVELGTATSRPWRAHARSARKVRRLADGRLVTSGFEDGDVPSLALWAPTGGPEPLRRTRLPAHRSIAVVPGGGATVVVGGEDGALSWWDLDAGREVRRIEQAHAGGIAAVALSQDGLLCASGGADRTLRLWDARDGRELERVSLTGSKDLVTSLRFDEQGLYVGLGTGVIVLLRPRG